MASELTTHSAFGQISWAIVSEPIRARGIIAKYTRVRQIVSTLILP